MILRPKNWSEYQHYKDRSPPWIKLHRDLLNNREYMCLPLASKAIAPLLWLLASESKTGEFNSDITELSFRLRLTEKEVRDGLKPLIDNGFFVDASGMLAECLQVAIPETERETEKEAEKKQKIIKKETQIDMDFFASPEHHRLAEELNVNLTTEVLKFKDYHKAKGSKFKDWDAALRTWIRNSADFRKTNTPAKPASNLKYWQKGYQP